MDDTSLHPLIAWAADNPLMTMLLIGLVAFAEALALFGLLVPGALLLFGLGALVALGELDLSQAMLIAIIGALAGDCLSYFIGRRYQHQLLGIWPFSRYRQIMVRGERFFDRYGASGIVIGRIVGATRPIVPVVAGMMNMPPWRFLPVVVLSCLLWAPIYILPGYVFGYSLDVAAGVAMRLGIMMGIVVGLYYLVRLTIKGVQQGVFQPLIDLLETLLRRAQQRPRLAALTHWLEDPKLPRSGALGPLALHCAAGLTVWGTMAWMTWREVSPAHDLISWALLDWREPWLDRLMLAVAGLGHPISLLLVTAGVAVWLVLRRRNRTAGIWCLGVLTGMLVLQMWHMVAETQVSAQFWSLAGAKIVVLLGVYSVLISSQLPTRPRLSSYLTASSVALLVIVAQIYLGATSVFAAISGIALASAWASAVGIAYRIGHRRHFLARPMGRWFYAMLLLMLSFGGLIHYDHLAREYRIEPADEVVSSHQWQGAMPLMLDALQHPRSNLLVAANPQQLESRLQALGFEHAPAFHWQQILQTLRPEPSFADLPVFPRTRYGRAPVLEMMLEDEQSALMMRLWQSNARLDDGRALYVGSLSDQALGLRGYFFSLREERPVGREALLDMADRLGGSWARISPETVHGERQWHWLLRVDFSGWQGGQPDNRQEQAGTNQSARRGNQ